jgi:hypothetical protein
LAHRHITRQAARLTVRMKRFVLILGLIAAALLLFPWSTTPAIAQTECYTLLDGTAACPPPDSKCVKNRYGDWYCSPPGGDARLDLHGEPVCGTGACVRDINGLYQCSTQSRGAAAIIQALLLR